MSAHTHTHTQGREHTHATTRLDPVLAVPRHVAHAVAVAGAQPALAALAATVPARQLRGRPRGRLWLWLLLLRVAGQLRHGHGRAEVKRGVGHGEAALRARKGGERGG